MRVRILGALRVDGGEHPLPLGSRKQKALLALLLVRAGSVVSVETIVDELWDDPPASALSNLRAYAGGLRRVLNGTGGDAMVVKTGSGYVARVADGEFDLLRWRELIGAGRGALLAGDPSSALDRLRQGLGLWRGQALADVTLGPVLTAWRDAVHEQRVAAVEDVIEALLRLGQLEVASEQARELLATAPMRERAAALLMRARYRAGDVPGALAVYEATRRTLAEELGVEPGEELGKLQRQVLNRDRELTPLPAGQANTPRPRGEMVVPHQLPADVPGFTGRAGTLAGLDALLSTRDGLPPATVVAIAGTAGVGKTALAVHWAHQVADRFPDGQVYVNLRGFDPGGAAMSASDAVRAVLEAFEVAPQRVPSSLDAQVGLYRSLLDGRRVLIVLDNARDSAQVRPLLPGTPGSLAVVTSRTQLSGLVAADGAHPLAVDLLSVAESRDMLTRRLGRERIAAESAAVEEIIALCARLPMALAIVMARAATHPGFRLAALADQLRYARGGLDAFDTGDPLTDMRAVFSWSYHALTPAAADLFRLLGLHPALDITAPAAASLAGRPLRHVRTSLAELAHAHLLIEHTPGRYTFHDLLRAYAAELAEEAEPTSARHAAIRRILDHYLHSAYAAERLMCPDREQIGLDPAQPGVTPEQSGDHHAALAWFAAEHQVLLAAIQRSVEIGFESYAWKIAWSLEDYFEWRGHWHELVDTQQTALDAAERVADRAGEALAHRGLARAYTRMERYDMALSHLRLALDVFTEAGDRAGQACVHRSLGIVLFRQGRNEDALRHDHRALELNRAIGDESGQALSLNNLGYHYGKIGDYQQAVINCQQAIAINEKIGALNGVAHTWDSLGYVHFRLGRHAEAAACYQRALELIEDLGDRTSMAEMLTRLGEVHQAAGDSGPAREAWRQALQIFEELGLSHAEQVRTRLAGRVSGRS